MSGRRATSGPHNAWPLWLLAGLAAVALAFPVLWHQIHADISHRLVDLEVYREAGRSVRIGRAVYEFRTPPPQLLPFTYPPFPALLAVPLSLISFGAAGWVWELSSLVLLAGLVAYCFGPVVAEWREWLAARTSQVAARRVVAVVAPMLLPLMMWLEPVRTTFRFGQVNIGIAVLVIADCCVVRTRWPRGVLVGVAAAIKLTPGLFIPYLWLSGRRRAAYVATGTFVVCQLVAAAVIPSDAEEYWTDALLSSSRLGDNRVTANVAIRGALLRLRMEGPVLAAVLGVAVVVVLIIGMSRALFASRGGAELAGVTIVGLTSVAISPVSWDHHLIWLVPAFALLLADPGRADRLIGAGLLAALFYTRVPWLVADEARLSSGAAEVVYRALNLSFAIATVVLVVVLPLKSLAGLPTRWSRREDYRAAPE